MHRIDPSHLQGLQDLTEPGVCWEQAAAASKGRFQVLEWLNANGYPCNVGQQPVEYEVAANGTLECLKWVLGHCRRPGAASELFRCAMRSGNLEMVKWLHESGTSSGHISGSDGGALRLDSETLFWDCGLFDLNWVWMTRQTLACELGLD